MFEIEVKGNGRPSEEDKAAYQRLYRDLKKGLDVGEVTPKQVAGFAANRGFIDSVMHLVVQGSSLGAFSAMFEILKVWLAERPTYEITLKYPDGSELKASHLSMEQAIALHEKHVSAIRPQRANE